MHLRYLKRVSRGVSERFKNVSGSFVWLSGTFQEVPVCCKRNFFVFCWVSESIQGISVVYSDLQEISGDSRGDCRRLMEFQGVSGCFNWF